MDVILIFEKSKLMFTIQYYYMAFEKKFILKRGVASFFTPRWTCTFLFKVDVNTHAYSHISVCTDTYKNGVDDVSLLSRYHQR